MIIYGAGMAGLLAASMLRNLNPTIREARDTFPNNHAALLRFRSDAVSQATSIPFKKVRVRKGIWSEGWRDPTIDMTNRYAIKVTGGSVHDRSVLDISPVERYIAPYDFLKQMYNAHWSHLTLKSPMLKPEPCISTIPMDELMRIVGWKDIPQFKFRPIISVNISLPIEVDLYQTVYYPQDDQAFYRASITGNNLIIEYIDTGKIRWEPSGLKGDAKIVLRTMGLEYFCDVLPGDVIFKRQQYGKLLPIDEHQRQEFILAMTDKYGIYSVGRFATWRQILLDDVVNDVKAIGRMISQRSHYRLHLSTAMEGK